MKKAALYPTLAVLAVALTACGGGAEAAAPATPIESATHDVTLEFAWYVDGTIYAACQHRGGPYADINHGTPVTLKTGAGETVGASALSEANCESGGGAFTWTVIFPDVPMDADFYSVEVGQRGEVTKSRQDLEANDYTFQTSLGG
ncbi:MULTISPECIES: hypothetical protein [unclassified Geodermatophilus]